MNLTETVTRVVPTLKCNNRRLSLAFFEGELGMNLLLEDGAWTSLGDASKVEKLTLEEAPPNRTRVVEGHKKLAKVIIKVADPAELETLLARGIRYTKLYKGKVGYGFEALSPEGDLFLLHAEENHTKLVEIVDGVFHALESFTVLTAFEVEQVVLHVENRLNSQQFYEQFLPRFEGISFEEVEGADLAVPVAETWDVSQLKFVLTDFNGVLMKEKFPKAFLPKAEKFVSMEDPSHIELWFEGL